MSNHYHLLVETPKDGLNRAMRYLNGVYTQAFNRRQRRVGQLFQGRCKAILVDKDAYLLELSRYIYLNSWRVKQSRSFQVSVEQFEGVRGRSGPAEMAQRG